MRSSRAAASADSSIPARRACSAIPSSGGGGRKRAHAAPLRLQASQEQHRDQHERGHDERPQAIEEFGPVQVGADVRRQAKLHLEAAHEELGLGRPLEAFKFASFAVSSRADAVEKLGPTAGRRKIRISSGVLANHCFALGRVRESSLRHPGAKIVFQQHRPHNGPRSNDHANADRNQPVFMKQLWPMASGPLEYLCRGS